jgi:hypothetical protein
MNANLSWRAGPGRLLAVVLASTVAALPVATFAQRAGRGANNPVRNVPIAGTVAADGQTFSGTLDIERFEAVGEQLLAVGQVSGKFSGGKHVNHQSVAIPVQGLFAGPATGFGGATGSLHKPAKVVPATNVVPATWDPARAPTIIQAQAACDVLTLVLGPLHLDLLGLVVDLNVVELAINAVPGAGNLLGNLLCAVVGLLDGTGGVTGTLTDIAGLLTQIVNILNGILAGL